MAAVAQRTSTIDGVDRKIVHCLIQDGRAPFRLIGEVIGVSEQTVARRYRALVEGGVLRVLVVADTRTAGRTTWFVRIRCRPDATESLADAIAARDDVSWVSVTSGGGELICLTWTEDPDGSSSVLRRLPRTAQVLSFTAYSVLHQHVGGESEWTALPDGLTREQADRLRSGGPPANRRGGPEAGAGPSPDDRTLLGALGRDGRASIAALARETGWPSSRVAARLGELIASGAAYVDVDLSAPLLGFGVTAYLFLTVAPGKLAVTGRALALHPETSFAAAITGSANLLAAVVCRDAEALYLYVTTKVGALSAIRQVEIVPTLRRVKQAGTLVRQGRLLPPT